jgi:hypothetical protein
MVVMNARLMDIGVRSNAARHNTPGAPQRDRPARPAAEQSCLVGRLPETRARSEADEHGAAV